MISFLIAWSAILALGLLWMRAILNKWADKDWEQFCRDQDWRREFEEKHGIRLTKRSKP